MRLAVICVAMATFAVVSPASAWAQAAPGRIDLGGQKLAVPSAPEVRDQLYTWLETQTVEADARATIDAIWEGDLAGLETAAALDRLAESLAALDPRFAELVAYASVPPEGVLLPEFPWLLDESEELAPLVRNNLRLFYGRWLSREMYYDEALAHLGDLDTSDVVDPATLLFYQGVTHARLLNKQQGIDALDMLLDDLDETPTRYYALAVLIQNDLQQLEDESLDFVSRQMKDVEIRLNKGRAGKTVQVKSDEIVDALDKMIAKLEEQQQQQSGGGGGGGSAGGIQSSGPADESSAAGGRGEGDVDSRDIGSGADWGNLDPRDREQALQDVSESYPSYYREIVQEYFKRRAAGDATGPAP